MRLTAGGAVLYFHWTNQTDHLSVDAIKWDDMVPVFQTYWAPTSQLFRRFEPGLPAVRSGTNPPPPLAPKKKKAKRASARLKPFVHHEAQQRHIFIKLRLT